MYLKNGVTEGESMVPGEALGREWLGLLRLAGNSVEEKCLLHSLKETNFDPTPGIFQP